MSLEYVNPAVAEIAIVPPKELVEVARMLALALKRPTGEQLQYSVKKVMAP